MRARPRQRPELAPPPTDPGGPVVGPSPGGVRRGPGVTAFRTPAAVTPSPRPLALRWLTRPPSAGVEGVGGPVVQGGDEGRACVQDRGDVPATRGVGEGRVWSGQQAAAAVGPVLPRVACVGSVPGGVSAGVPVSARPRGGEALAEPFVDAAVPARAGQQAGAEEPLQPDLGHRQGEQGRRRGCSCSASGRPLGRHVHSCSPRLNQANLSSLGPRGPPAQQGLSHTLPDARHPASTAETGRRCPFFCHNRKGRPYVGETATLRVFPKRIDETPGLTSFRGGPRP